MTLQTFFIIIGSFFGIIILVLSFVLTYHLGKGKVKNNPNEAIVFVKNGVEIVPYKGKLALTSKSGCRFSYLKEKFVLVPNNYTVEYCKNKRAIWIGKIGQLISSPFDSSEQLSDTERENLIYELTESQIGSEAVRAIKGNKGSSILMIIIIGVIVVTVAFFAMQYLPKMMNKTTDTTTQPAITQEKNLPPIGEK